MKKLLLTAAAILTTLNIFAQGQGSISFTSVGAPDAKKIRDASGAFAGAGYAVALYWGAAGTTDDNNLVQIGASANMLTGTSAGTYFGGGRTITTAGSALNGPVLAFQVRAWSTANGTSYEAVRASGQGFIGKQTIFETKTKDLTNPLETTPNLYAAAGYTGFSLTPVPEPSVIGLGLLGAGALLMLRRRK